VRERPSRKRRRKNRWAHEREIQNKQGEYCQGVLLEVEEENRAVWGNKSRRCERREEV
jgi:hypothetical protein